MTSDGQAEKAAPCTLTYVAVFLGAALALLSCSPTSAAIHLQTAPRVPLEGGFVQYTVSAFSTAGETIIGVDTPTIYPSPNGASGPHQVWLNNSGTFRSATQGDHIAGLWNGTWTPYDSYWFFDSSNSVSLGAAFTEANSGAGGAAGLPSGALGPPTTGFGSMGTVGGAPGAKTFTVASGLRGPYVPLVQIVLKEGESVGMSLTVLGDSGFAQVFTDYFITVFPPLDLPPVVKDLNLGRLLRAQTLGLGPLPAAGDPPLYWSLSSFSGAGMGGDFSVDPTTGRFSWDSANAPHGTYSVVLRATNFADTDLGTMTFTLVPEPSALFLLSLATFGFLGYSRVRDSAYRSNRL
jgi:hypothetical protein